MESDGNAKNLNKKVYTFASCGFLLLRKRANAQIDEHICQIICDVMNIKLTWWLFTPMVSQVFLYSLATWLVVTLDLFQQVRETKIFLGLIN